MKRTIAAHICPKHGFQHGDTCSECISCESTIASPAICTNSWVPGWYENIAPEPIYIRDKRHLFAECEKRGCLAKAFMKPKSQGMGWEHKRR